APVRSLFAERGAEGKFALRRGFALAPGERVLLAEDVVTTGGSVMEVAPLVTGAGATVAGIAAIADRSRGGFRPPVPFFALTALNFETWPADALPAHLAGVPVDKPGSRPGAPRVAEARP
ncbi:MAG TPA: orotate phosphoribosyltransferase, partial [Phycisphaerales bacterium]|nr:orotate phosphoribosyltransferase [Phycisphaerales bacterium]